MCALAYEYHPEGRRRPRFGVQMVAEDVTWPDYRAALRAVESYGYDTVWNFDHLYPVFNTYDRPAFETATTLAAMALETSRIHIGTLVNGVLYRDPGTMAKQAVMVDILSGGRLEFGFGAAWAVNEFNAYGIPYPSNAERIARTDEALQIIRSMWTQEKTSFAGQYYQINDAYCNPKPIQQPHPPIMVGGGGEQKTLRVVARHADIWNGIASPAGCAHKIDVLRQYCAEIGRDPHDIEMSVHPSMAIGKTRADAERTAQEIASRRRQTLDGTWDTWLIGTPDEIIEKLHAYIDAGITHWVMGMYPPFDNAQLSMFAEKVIPAFR